MGKRMTARPAGDGDGEDRKRMATRPAEMGKRMESSLDLSFPSSGNHLS